MTGCRKKTTRKSAKWKKMTQTANNTGEYDLKKKPIHALHDWHSGSVMKTLSTVLNGSQYVREEKQTLQFTFDCTVLNKCNTHRPVGGTGLVPMSHLVAVPTVCTPLSQVLHQDWWHPGKGRETSPTAGWPDWACSDSICTGTTHHLEEDDSDVFTVV